MLERRVFIWFPQQHQLLGVLVPHKLEDQQDYGTPTADQVNPKTGLTPNEEQLARNRRLADTLDRLHARSDQ